MEMACVISNMLNPILETLVQHCLDHICQTNKQGPQAECGHQIILNGPPELLMHKVSLKCLS